MALRQRAQRILERWAGATVSADPGSIAIAGDLTNGGGWNGPHADDHKIAFMSGVFEASPRLSSNEPPAGQVSWEDGSTEKVSLLSAAEALQAMADELRTGGGRCPECQPMRVTGAQLVSGEVQTPRGPATVPLWQFEWAPGDEPIDPITYVAIRDLIVVSPLEPGDIRAMRIDQAYGSAASSDITVEFVGSPYSGENPCGADYTAEAVESDLAVVVIVHEHHSAGVVSGACALVGAARTAVAHLSAPLGERVVLDIQDGSPVPLSDAPAPSFRIK